MNRQIRVKKVLGSTPASWVGLVTYQYTVSMYMQTWIVGIFQLLLFLYMIHFFSVFVTVSVNLNNTGPACIEVRLGVGLGKVKNEFHC